VSDDATSISSTSRAPVRPDPEHLAALPKVELHCHLEGAMRPGTLRALAGRHGIPLPAVDADELYRFRDLEHFIEIFDLVCSVLVDADDFHRLAYEVVLDGAAQGICHREVFFSPWFHLGRGVPFARMWAGLAAGLRDGMDDTGTTAALVLDFDKPAGPAHAREMVELAGSCPRDLLVGFGGDNLEAGIDHAAFAAAYQRARQLGLRTTIHAGEFSVQSVADAVRSLGCDRIDHGVLLVDDESLLAEVVERRIPLTCCPTSDIEISKVWPDLDGHSYPELRRRGVLATLNSDDPALLRHDLNAEYVTVAERFGFDLGEMEAIALDGIEASWLDASDRASLRHRFEARFDDLRRQRGLPARGTN
jgi:adenosine deaminase